MTKGAISKLADRLEGRGLITRTRVGHDDDRRVQSLALTAAGRALVPKLATLADDNEAELFGHLTKADRAAVENVMRGIVAQLGLGNVPIE